MTDLQLLTLVLSAAISIVLPASALIYANSRINDAKEAIRGDLAALKAELLSEIRLITHRLASLDQRLAALEHREEMRQ